MDFWNKTAEKKQNKITKLYRGIRRKRNFKQS